MSRKFEYNKGDKFGRLTLTSNTYTIQINGQSRRVVDCLCECGSEMKSVRTDTLTQGQERSCGCFLKDWLKKTNITHGMSYTVEYKCWQALKDRCTNTNNPGHDKWYSDVPVFEDWINSFEKFYTYMGPCPEGMNSIDRILGSKGYEPGNVRWSYPAQQMRNRGKMKNNTSGHTGVSRKEGKNGVSWIAFSRKEDGSCWSKSFSENKYGKDAKNLAIEYRAYMIEFLRESGIEYGEEHGL